MKNKLWIVFLALSIAFACAAGYMYFDYQNKGAATEQEMTDLRAIRDSAKADSTELTLTAPVATAAVIDGLDGGEAEVEETAIPADYTGFDVAESETAAEDQNAEDALVSKDAGETADAAEAPAATPTPVSALDIPNEELVVPTATATVAVNYSLNTVVPSEVEDSEPAAVPTKEKYVLKEEDILPEYRELYETNHDLIGWLTIDSTKIDYPVVQSTDPEYYLEHDFYGNSNYNGMLIVTPEYDVLTPGQNILIHGHNMRSGKMFNNLQYYASESFFKNHQYILFDTLTEHRKYQVVSAFYTRIFGDDEPGFRYNIILDGSLDAAEYFVSGIRSSAAYDTGVYYDTNDEYLELSTCAYQANDGRFVVVAKRVYM